MLDSFLFAFTSIYFLTLINDLNTKLLANNMKRKYIMYVKLLKR